MEFVVVTSKKDIAGENIAVHLEKKGFPVYKIKEDSIYSDDSCFKNTKADFLMKKTVPVFSIPKKPESFFLIFATRHKAEAGRKTFSIHAPGNWHDAEFGGKQETLCRTSASVIKQLFLELNKELKKSQLNNKLKDFSLTLECTHHGPAISLPCCFIEIGSTEKEWRDEKAAELISETIINFVKNFVSYQYKTAIGIGGPHYCPNFNKLELKDIAFAHICPKYALPLTKEMLQQAISKTQEKIDLIILDWKGLGQYKQEVLNIIEELDLEYQKI